MRWRSKRIGVDLDSFNELTLLKTFFNARSSKAKVDVQRTRHGYHLRIFKRHSLATNFQVRMMLGDDPWRLYVDEQRLQLGVVDSIDTLFQAKSEKGIITREEPHRVLSLPFYSQFPAKKAF